MRVLAKQERYTAFWDEDRDGKVDMLREMTSIDYILLSPGQTSSIVSASVPDEHDPAEATDHFAVVVHRKTGGKRG